MIYIKRKIAFIGKSPGLRMPVHNRTSIYALEKKRKERIPTRPRKKSWVIWAVANGDIHFYETESLAMHIRHTVDKNGKVKKVRVTEI